MKINSIMRISLSVFTFLCSVLSWGQTVLANYKFENNLTVEAGSIGSPTFTASTTVSYFAGVTGQAVSYASSAGKYFDLVISTTGYSNIDISFSGRSSAASTSWVVTGDATGGTTFSGVTSLACPNGSFATLSPFILGATYDNKASIRVRITATGSATATLRLDDLIIRGTSMSSNTITTNTALTGSPYCVSGSTGASVSVPFTSVGTFTGNTYTAQLSNAAGSFGTPVNIGTLVSDLNSGTITTTIPAGTAAGTGYRIRVISNNPVVTGPDNTVNLTVNNAAVITAQPSATIQNVCQNAAATALSVTATGTTLSYQWYSNTTNSNSGGTAVGTNSASYAPVTTTAGTLYYYCVVTAVCGASATSNVSGAVNVTAIPVAPSGTINVSANPSCGAATLSYSAPSANIYWQTSATGTLTTSPTTTNYTSSATANTYTIYVRELSGTSCWSPATSVTFTVVAPVNITAQPTNKTITEGSNTTFTVTATGTSLTYQWQVDTGGGFVNLTNVAPYSTVTTSILTITAAPITMNGYLYRCIVSGAAPCGNVISNSGSLSVTLTPPNNPTAILPCYGNTTLGLSWVASSGGSTPDGYMVFALAGATAPIAT